MVFSLTLGWMLCNVVLYVSVNVSDKMNIIWEAKLRSVFQNMYLSNDFSSLFPLDAEKNFIQKVEIRCHSFQWLYTHGDIYYGLASERCPSCIGFWAQYSFIHYGGEVEV